MVSVCPIFVINRIDIKRARVLFLQAFDILKDAVSLSDAVLHDVQSVSTLSEVCIVAD